MMLLADPDARTAHLVIPDVHDGPAALDSTGEWAFMPTKRLCSNVRAAWLDGQEVRMRIDRSRHRDRHPFLYGTVLPD